ncbi:hypothetical protein PYW07_002451 [Mythimna separata]|uniref:G-protein coupled receptors family 2 profile 2 domain-containing protein n=1 Tax=Mythimna separata TaxID=271217 RepID=A0AAD8DU54_MYTSE|nr:hypothetical protein PYW07_002451 [Mythimna separata]
MSDNESSTRYGWSINFWRYLFHIMPYIMLVLMLAALIYGLTSCCILKKFRNYRNFVFLNAILTYFLLYCLDIMLEEIEFLRTSGLFSNLPHYLATAKNHWLLVISHMFYVDIVKVFNQNVRRRYLKSFMFGWGVPLITYLITIPVLHYYFKFVFTRGRYIHYIFWVIMLSDQIIPVTVNCFLYIATGISLCRSFSTNTHTSTDIWRRLYIATLIFLLSDVALLYQLFINMTYLYPGNIVFFLLLYLNPLSLVVFLVAVRSNRKAWYDFYVKWINRRQRGQDIIMHERVIREPAERYRAVLDA